VEGEAVSLFINRKSLHSTLSSAYLKNIHQRMLKIAHK